jgi:hypothetical protein
MFSRFLAAFVLVWAGGNGQGARRRALEEVGGALAPLILFALVWLLVGAPEDPKAWARPS